MVHESCLVPAIPTSIGGMALRCVWSVDADRTYDVSAGFARETSASLRPKGGTGLIACRTVGGAGRLYTIEDQAFDAREGTLLVIPFDRLARYHAAGERWHFWWFEFDIVGPTPIPCGRTVIVPIESSDKKTLDRILANLRLADPARQMLACSLFQTLLFEWVARRTDRSEATRDQDRIQRVIAHMYDHLESSLTIGEMARMAHLSEPHFRRVFREVTGYSPKKFYDRLRLAWAEHMLRTERKNVSEVSRALGFCTPFHFSRVFRQYFGFPPSRLCASDEA